MTDSGEPSERTLILRLWREGDAADAIWRCSVQDPASRQRRGFSDIPDLLSFLQSLTASSDTPRTADPGTGANGRPATQSKAR
ncbi:MAG: hypothetical protein ACHQPI_04990 [Thermoanaerobaculia bacterium]